MARRHHTAIHGHSPYPTSMPGTAIALTVPDDTDMTGALCTTVVPDVFFPQGDEMEVAEQLAKAICSACPVRAACLDGAIRRDERFGIFGGLTTAERDALTGRVGGCGSRAGYARHIRACDTPCRACREQQTAASAAWRATKKARAAGPERSDLEAAA